MSDAQVQDQQQTELETESESLSFLDQAIAATKQTEPDQTKALLASLSQQAMSGTVTWDRNLTITINKAMEKIDQALSKQLSAIMHAEKLQKLEGSWRGLHHLVSSSETGGSMKIRVMNVTKKEIFKDLDKAVEFDQSQTFKKIYESEYGTAGGQPYGLLVGDYEFTNHPNDVDLLSNMSGVAAASFCPFISAAGPKMLGLEDYTQLSEPRDLEKVFETQEFTKLRSFRESEDSRFVSLVMPRVLSRMPYGSESNPIEEFNFEEFELDNTGKAKEAGHDQYCWMNASYVMASTITKAFSEHGWCTGIRGVEGGGKVENLPTHTFKDDEGNIDAKCPTEIGITERREAELSKMGFLPLCHFKNTDYAVFFGAQTMNKPKKFDNPDATANAEISARLPYILATSRVAHYLKVIARDKIGSFETKSSIEKYLQQWISQYTNANPDASQADKMKRPLVASQVVVEENPESPGSFNAVAHLQPWLQMEELTASLRLVTKLPGQGG